MTDKIKEILALGITASKMTTEKLYEAISSFLKQKDLGEMREENLSYRDFNTPGGISLVNVRINEDNLSSFEKNAIDNDLVFNLKKNRETNEYFIVFQGESREQIEKALKSYKNNYEELHFQKKSQEIKKENQEEKSVEKEKLSERTREVTPYYD